MKVVRLAEQARLLRGILLDSTVPLPHPLVPHHNPAHLLLLLLDPRPPPRRLSHNLTR